MVTAYGSPDAEPEPADVISYLEWCRSTGDGSVAGGAQGRADRAAAGRLDTTHSG